MILPSSLSENAPKQHKKRGIHCDPAQIGM
ncbi:hypothetical protein CBM2597_A50870 [Cupriavidus taiwanensis]|nr:hypothetical protein CBM2597_A50870 [Cupriavidus taiwanensis]